MSGKVKLYDIVINGSIPSKKNSRIQFYNKSLGRTINIPSNDYKKWHKKASAQVLIQGKRSLGIKNAFSISLRFYFPDNRGSDLTNKAESIMDMLVDNNVLLDDKWQVTGKVLLNPIKIDRSNPRCEIRIIVKEERMLL